MILSTRKMISIERSTRISKRLLEKYRGKKQALPPEFSSLLRLSSYLQVFLLFRSKNNMHRFLRTSFLLSILGILLTLGITSISSLLMMVGNILGDTRVTLATQIYHVARLFPHPRSLDATLDYNESRLLYKVARYTESVKKLKQIPQDSLRFEMLHNLGNTLYRL